MMRWVFIYLPRIVILSFSLTVLTIAWSISPDARGFGTHEQLGWEPCGFLSVHNKPCITCGMTTSFASTVRLDLVRGFSVQPAGFVLCLVMMATPVFVIHSLITGAPIGRVFAGRNRTLWTAGLPFLVLGAWLWKWWTW